MNTVLSYLRVIVLLGSCLVGLQIPVFVDQYGKHLAARVAESRVALSEFQDDADRYFEGSLERLIDHYRADADEVFVAGGESIAAIVQRNMILELKWRDFNMGWMHAYAQAVFSPVPEVEEDVWKDFTYAVQVDPVSLGFGLVMGLLFTMLSEVTFRGCLRLPGCLCRPCRRKKKPPRHERELSAEGDERK